MRIPSTSLKEIPSPDGNYCICLFGLPTPKGEPQRLTFTLYKNQNGAKQAIFELPEDLYCCDGIDCIYWDNGSTAITYTVNQYKSIFIYDFIFQIKKEKPVPDNLVKCYWDKNIGNWILKSRSRIEEFRIYYSHNDIRDFFFFNLGNTQIELIKTPFKENKDGTNLRIIQNYIDLESSDGFELIGLSRWTNCNTRDDYHKILKIWEKESNENTDQKT